MLKTLKFMQNHPKMKYFVTALGCGIAGYKVSGNRSSF